MPSTDPHHPRKAHAPGGSAELWTLAFPIIVATLSQSLMGLVDTFFMGRIGTAQQGAVGLAAVIFITIGSFFLGLLSGVSTFAAQHYGARRFARCGRDGWLALYAALPSAAVLGCAALGAKELFALLGADEMVAPHAASYFGIRMAGSLFMLVNFAVENFLRGVGDTRTPMYFALGTNVLNALLNYAFVLGNFGAPRLEASGAAIASVLATAVCAAAYMAFFLTGERQRRFRTRLVRLAGFRDFAPFLKVGGPIGGVWALEMVSWAFFLAIVSRLGNAELAATSIVFQALHFSFMGAVSLATAATTLVGQYLGAEEPATARKTARTTIRWGVTYCVALGLVFLAGRYRITAFFSADPAVVELGARLFIYAAVFQFFDGLGISSTGVIRGAGDTRWPMIVMVILAWGVFAPLTYVLAFPAGLGIDGAWIAVIVFIAANGVCMYYRERSGKWLAMRV